MIRQTWNPESPCCRFWELCNEMYGGDTEKFVNVLTMHCINGFVESTPTAFIMARPVDKNAPHEVLEDCSYVFEVDEVNAWLVWGLSGEQTMDKFLNHPEYFELPYIGFGRPREIGFTFYPSKRLHRLMKINNGRSDGIVTQSIRPT